MLMMPLPFAVDLRWRIVWLYLSTDYSPSNISRLLHVSECTVWRYIALFRATDDVIPRERKNGPDLLIGSFEQVSLLRIIIDNPGIYLNELQMKLYEKFGVEISVSTICRTLKIMGCTCQVIHRVAIQRSDYLRGHFMSQISVYDPSMLVFLDETGCDRRDAVRK